MFEHGNIGQLWKGTRTPVGDLSGLVLLASLFQIMKQRFCFSQHFISKMVQYKTPMLFLNVVKDKNVDRNVAETNDNGNLQPET